MVSSPRFPTLSTPSRWNAPECPHSAGNGLHPSSPPESFFGFELMETAGVAMATPEKALLDYLYLRPACSNLFRTLPEWSCRQRFNSKSARRMIQRISPSAGARWWRVH